MLCLHVSAFRVIQKIRLGFDILSPNLLPMRKLDFVFSKCPIVCAMLARVCIHKMVEHESRWCERCMDWIQMCK